MFKVGDRVRIKKAGTYEGVTYETNAEGVVVGVGAIGISVRFSCAVLFEGYLEKPNQVWYIQKEEIELVPTKRKRKKKEPIPEGWE